MSEKKDTMIKDAIILCLITVILGAILAGVYTITKKPIEDAQKKATAKACQEVVAEGDEVLDDVVATGPAVTFLKTHKLDAQETKEESEDLLSNYVEIKEIRKTKDGGKVYVADALKGYGGKISFVLGMSKIGLTTGISITEQSETAGLGAKCEEDEFKNRFKKLWLQDAEELYTKDKVEEKKYEYKDMMTGEEKSIEYTEKIQAITGATVTSRAITRAVKGIIYFHYSEGAKNNE